MPDSARRRTLTRLTPNNTSLRIILVASLAAARLKRMAKQFYSLVMANAAITDLQRATS